MKKLLFIVLLFSSQVFAEVRLPAIIGDHMVLQQKSKVKFWGWADPAEEIKIKSSWDTTTYKVKANSGGRWMLMINTPSAGGPHSISFKGWNDPIVVNDVLIGEVWVCSGQSNMEWSGNQRLPQSLEEAPKATNTSIRFFYIPKATSETPQDDVKAKWVVCSPEEMKKFSAIGYFFGKKINEVMKYPMGLINSNWGGTPAETWTSSEVVMADPVLKGAAAQLKPADWWPTATALAYNAMIYPILNYDIAGVLWYQGESNVGTNATYEAIFTKMISSWRKGWGKEFPFYFVQIAPYNYGNDNIDGALLREQQTRASTFPKTGMVVVSDLVDTVTDIHPRKKVEVAQRLANIALVETYGQTGIVWRSPSFKSMSIEKDKIRVSFNNAENGLVTKGSSPTSFYIAGSDGKYVPALAKIDKNGTVLVWNKDIKEPQNVRFGFTNTDMPNLFSKEGLPVDLFRTDGKTSN
jgi:sialate O-acetylesterase